MRVAQQETGLTCPWLFPSVFGFNLFCGFLFCTGCYGLAARPRVPPGINRLELRHAPGGTYIYIHMYMYMCVFGLTRGTHQVCSHYDDDIWPLQDIVLLLVVCARVNHHYILPARLHCSHFCNTNDSPSTSLWYAIHHTILVITISCKGQPLTHRSVFNL